MAIPWLDIVLAHIGNHFEREVTSYTSATSQISSVHDFFLEFSTCLGIRKQYAKHMSAQQ